MTQCLINKRLSRKAIEGMEAVIRQMTESCVIRKKCLANQIVVRFVYFV